MTSPRLYRAGSTQELTVSLFSEPLPWIVNATLAYSNSIIDTDEGQFTSLSDGTLKLKVNLEVLYNHVEWHLKTTTNKQVNVIVISATYDLTE